ncbi:MAG: LrgB family protein [Ruminococcaceae bacterium]|nr:LrgB family protein [Oscillospiraceae bacterium]
MTDILKEFSALAQTPLFGVTIALVMFSFAKMITSRFSTPLMNPLLISTIFIWAIYYSFGIPISSFDNGGKIILMFLPLATAALAFSMYNKRKLIKKNLVPILAGCIVGVVVSVGSVLILCHIFGIDEAVTKSLIPKSVTTAIAMPLADSLGGYSSIASAGVFVTGLFGAVMCPYFIKWTRLNNSVAAGLGIGASCHALGTAQAVKIGETESAMGGIAIGICGLLTVIVSLFI